LVPFAEEETVVDIRMDPMRRLRRQLETADVDLLREMVRAFAETLMSADADAVCGATYGERSEERVNRRNGYRERDFDCRTGSIALRVPKLREGTYYPEWLFEHRKRAPCFTGVGVNMGVKRQFCGQSGGQNRPSNTAKCREKPLNAPDRNRTCARGLGNLSQLCEIPA